MILLYCLDIGCDVTLVNHAWFLKKALTKKILKIAILLKVRDIKSSNSKLDKFVSMSLYFLSIDLTNCPTYTHI